MAVRAELSRGQWRADSDRPLFIYDGDCGFCRKWASWLTQRVGSSVRFSPFQAQEGLGRFNLTLGDVQSASFLIEHGRAYRGGRGIARAMAHGQGAWKLIGLLLDLPGLRFVSSISYRYIARNRRRLPAPDRELTV